MGGSGEKGGVQRSDFTHASSHQAGHVQGRVFSDPVSVLEDTRVSACAAACDGEKKGGWKFKSRRRRVGEEYQRVRRISNMPFDGGRKSERY